MKIDEVATGKYTEPQEGVDYLEPIEPSQKSMFDIDPTNFDDVAGMITKLNKILYGNS